MSEYTNGDMFDLRPGELLGIRVGLVADYCEPSGEHVTYVSVCLSMGLVLPYSLRVSYLKRRVAAYNDTREHPLSAYHGYHTRPSLFSHLRATRTTIVGISWRDEECLTLHSDCHPFE